MSDQNQNQSDSNWTRPPRLTVARRRTVNLGDYNSATFEVTLEEDLPPGKKKSEHLEIMWQQVTSYLAKKMLEEGVVEE